MAHKPHDTTKSLGASAPKLSPLKHNEAGEEIMDPQPMQPPLGYKKTLSLSEQIHQSVRLAKLQLLEAQAMEETEEEADDFEVGDDFQPLSPYENDHMPTLANLKKQAREINAAIDKAKREHAIEVYKNTLKKPADPPAQPPPEVNSDK